MKLTPEIGNRLANLGLVASLLVVLVHLPRPEAEGAWRFVHWFGAGLLGRSAVPFFFAVSGFFLAGHVGEPGWWRRESLKRVRTLLVPCFAWCALFFAFCLLGKLGLSALSRGAFDVAAYWQDKWAVGFGLTPFDLPFLAPAWYLRTLFLLVLASPLLAAAVRRFGLVALALLFLPHLAFSLAMDGWYGMFADSATFRLCRSLLNPGAVFYFAVGLWLRFRPAGIRVPRVAAAACLGLAVGLSATRLALLPGDAGRWIPMAVAMPLLLAGTVPFAPTARWPRTLVALSFPIYVLHYFWVHAVAMVLKDRPYATLTVSALTYVLAVGLSVGVALALGRFLPRVAAALSGGRWPFVSRA